LTPVMPTSAHYRKLAAESRQNASESEDADERDTLLRIAALWDDLAERKAQPWHAGQQQQQPQPDDNKKK
jgi:hypothetical protein